MKRIVLLYALMLLLALFAPLFEGNLVVMDNEDLIIEEGETVRFIDQTLAIHGDLLVRGTLILDNTILILNTNRDNRFSVEEGGTLRMSDSKMVSYLGHFSQDISYELTEGMNLLSFPYYQDDHCIKEVLEPLEGHYDKVFYYDQWDDSQPWKSFVVDRPDHYNSLHHINQTMGVEVNITKPINIFSSEVFIDNYNYELKKGWNWISYPLVEPVTVEEFFSDIIDDLNIVRSVTSGQVYDLTYDDYMYPGRGYKVSMVNHSDLSVYVPYGISEEYGEDTSESKGIRFTFEEGSSGIIQRSTIQGFGSNEDAPDLIIRSSSVTLAHNSFIDNAVGVRVEQVSTTIYSCSFESYKVAGIELKNASGDIDNNNFSSQDGRAIEAENSNVDIVNNHFNVYHGLYLKGSTGVIFENDFSEVSEYGIYTREGELIIEKNTFEGIEKAAVRTFGTDLYLKQNSFVRCGGGIHSSLGVSTIIDNKFSENIYGIHLNQVRDNSTVMRNEFLETLGWSVKIQNVSGVYVGDNDIYSGSYGMLLSGKNFTVDGNFIDGCDGGGLIISASSGFVVSNNIITNNMGQGIEVDGLSGLVKNNRILSNFGGVSIRSNIHFFNNTVSNNRLFGIKVNNAYPIIENATLSGNSNHAIKFEHSNAFVKTTSIIGSRYHLHLTSSNITVINSLFNHEMVWIDQNSELSIADSFTIYMKEDEILIGYDIRLPPGTIIKNVRNNSNVIITIDSDGYLDIVPPPNFHGTVNFFLDLIFFDEIESALQVTLIIEQVNDPPILEEVELNISYDPTRIRWVLRYIDYDDEPPAYIELVVDGNHYPMKELNSSDTSYYNGKLYYYEMYLEPGEYEYYYIAEETNPLGTNITVSTPPRTFTIDPEEHGIISNLVVGGISFIILILIILLFYIVLVKQRIKKSWDSKVIEPSDVNREDSSEPLLLEVDKRYVNVRSLPVLIRKIEVRADSLPVLKRKIEVKADSLPVLKRKIEVKADSLPVLKRKIEVKADSLLTETKDESPDITDFSSDESLLNDEEREINMDEPPEDIIDKVGDGIPDNDDEIVVDGWRKRRMLKKEDKRIIMAKHRVIKGKDKKSAFSRKLRQLKGQNS